MNPFLPLENCIPDGEPRVFGDRVYLYGSSDVVNELSYCSPNHYVFSASIHDLEHWTNHGIAFSASGPNSEVPWAEGVLYAPDVIEKDGIYYMYFNLSDGSEGVAISHSPAGPFTNAKQIYYPSPIEDGAPLRNIDPAGFVDEDGKAYYYWGQFNAQAAQLKDNMFELIAETYNRSIISEADHFFHEGSSMRKIGDTYYYIFCDISTGRANNLGYATSKSPLGPFTYQGVIINNHDSDPESWNNHGSIVQIKGQWYIFYHRSSNNSVYSRRACAEPITIDESGKILPVEMTTQGFSQSPSAYSRMYCSRACILKGGNYITQVEQNAQIIVHNKNGCYAGFKYLDFGVSISTAELQFTARICPKVEAGTIEIVLDAIDAPVIGKVHFAKQDKAWINVSTSMKA
ncbi:MAG: family 43 glycosylhydrolase, partial [Vallitaleaceae bacterium]|nr:family 43 glycosylhydrolase [Vallitaleaceae bacterium]